MSHAACLEQTITRIRRIRDQLCAHSNHLHGLLDRLTGELSEEIGGLTYLRKELERSEPDPAAITEAAYYAARADTFALPIPDDTPDPDAIPAYVGPACTGAPERSTQCPHCGKVGCACGCNDCVDAKEFAVRPAPPKPTGPDPLLDPFAGWPPSPRSLDVPIENLLEIQPDRLLLDPRCLVHHA